MCICIPYKISPYSPYEMEKKNYKNKNIKATLITYSTVLSGNFGTFALFLFCAASIYTIWLVIYKEKKNHTNFQQNTSKQ